MASRVPIELFAEDRAMTDVLIPIIRRIAEMAGVDVSVHSRCSGGGHGKALTELRAFQRAVEAGQPGLSRGVLVVGRDANCSEYREARDQITEAIEDGLFPGVAIACPDPHVERWLMADPESFATVVGVDPRPGRRKCERDLYKKKLASAVQAGGHPQTLGGIEFAGELVAAMDPYRAGQNEPSLGSFWTDLREVLSTLARVDFE